MGAQFIDHRVTDMHSTKCRCTHKSSNARWGKEVLIHLQELARLELAILSHNAKC
jgi:hypothetical protein